ncbi:MAG: asparaginase [Blastopirellula sp.]|nr:MAG: asparaginase [Blastopirellula sp.]
MKEVRIILTGGTIDKIHDLKKESLTFSKDQASQIPTLLNEARCYHPTLEQLMLKDSLEFTDSDRDRIVNAINVANESAIVVTHGTGTMDKSAQWIAERIQDKTVVLTGAMRPHSLARSDGPFNLGGAIIAAQFLPSGVYGVMNGRIFSVEKLKKNTQKSRFDIPA